MNKHTPGPWKSDEAMCPYGWNTNGDGVWIASVNNDHYTEGNRLQSGFPGNIEGKANARLIALSPTMYEYIEGQANAGDLEAKKIVENYQFPPKV